MAIVSGYCLFGTSVILTLAFKKQVVALKLNPTLQKFEIVDDNVKIPPDGSFYSVNTAYVNDWKQKAKCFLKKCIEKKRSLRYIGSMVADIHRTLFKGGIFFYPANNKVIL